jgi:hypothetical protein
MLTNKIKTSLLYIIFEALSRGGNTLIFFIGASLLSKQDYLNLLTLFSLETLILNFCPFFYNEIYYKLIDLFEKTKLIYNIFYYSIIYTLILVLIYFIFIKSINIYLDSNFLIILSIIVSSFIRIIYQNKSTFFQIDEHHKKAIKNKALPFFISFIGGLIGFFVFKDKITFFFVGRTIGLLILVLFENDFFPKREIILGKFKLDKLILLSILKRSFLMIVKGVTAWALGYGLISILKNNYPENTVFSIGLILNLWTLFLLISNGINSVYVPKFRNLFLNNGNFKQLENSTLKQYFLIVLICLAFYVILLYPASKNLVIKIPNLKQYYDIFHYVILIFIAQIFQFISTPYYYVYDKFNIQSSISIITSIISICFVYFYGYLYINKFLSIIDVIIAGYFIRSIPQYIYSAKKLKARVQ